MKTTLTTKVGANGVLTVPLNEEAANKTVRVTVETMGEGDSPPPTDHDAWLRFIEKTAGSIGDPTFERQPQGKVEERDALP